MDPQCPYCGHTFEKMLGRKRACPSCNGTFYSRKRPSDGQKVLLTEVDAAEVEGQTALLTLIQENHAENSAMDKRARQVARALDRQIVAEDLVAAYLTELVELHEQSWNWGLYRNAVFGQAESSVRRGDYDKAVDLFLRVCLIDLNGPRNVGGKDAGLLKRFPAFDPKRSFVAPGVLGRLEESAGKVGLSSEQLKLRFENVAASTGKKLGLPKSGKAAWEEFCGNLSPKT